MSSTSSATLAALDERPAAALAEPLRRFTRRERRLRFLGAAAVGAGVFTTWFLFACLADRLLQLSPLPRAMLLLVGVVAVGLIVVKPLGELLRGRIDWMKAAEQVEQRHPAFGERLRTVVSQLLAPAGRRGSSEMLRALLEDVTRQLSEEQPHLHLRKRPVVVAWTVAAACIGLVVALSRVESLGMPSLAARLVLPFSETRPVTRTRITVQPGHVTLHRGAPLDVRVRVQHLTRGGGGGVDIFTSEDGATFSRVTMLALGEDEYLYRVSAVDRDLRYYVHAGDATTDVLNVHVLRAPAVVEYRLRYDHPSYTGQGAVAVTSARGVVEAVAGTGVRLQVVATEPLRSATLAFGNGDTLKLTPTTDPYVVETRLTVRDDRRATLQLTSAGGLSSGPVADAVVVRTLPDRAPLVRLITPTHDLCLRPRDVLDIDYDARDDYGVLYLAMTVQVNGLPPREFPVRRRGDLRTQNGRLHLDLATLNVRVGDVVALGFVADDGAGNRGQSEALGIVVAPRTADADAHERVAALGRAAQLAAAARDDLQGALAAFEQAQRRAARPGSDHLGPRARAGGGLTTAAEGLLLLHQAILRACARSGSPAQADVLAGYTDRVRVQLSSCERLRTLDAAGEKEQDVLSALRPLIQPAQRLATELKTIADAERASAVRVDLANLGSAGSSAADAAAKEQREWLVRRAREDLARVILNELGFDPAAPDLDAGLQKRVDAAASLTRGVQPIDFPAAAVEWVTLLRQSAAVLPPLAGRFASAAAVESVRPDSDLVIAHDLQLAARATTRLMQSMLSWPDADRVFIAHPVDEFPAALRAVAREHALRRGDGAFPPPSSPPPPPTAKRAEIQFDGAAARAKLAEWATRVETSTGSELSGDVLDAEDLAIRANFETAAANYDAAAALDRALAQRARPPAQPGSLGEALGMVQRIDRVAADQHTLAQQTGALHDEERAAAMARDQEALAAGIGAVRAVARRQYVGTSDSADAGSRHRATATIQQVEELLTLMPQRLATAFEAADNRRAAVARVAEARRRVDAAATADERDAAVGATELAARAAVEAGTRLNALLDGISPDIIERSADHLRAFEPEAASSARHLRDDLSPALKTFHESARSDDSASTERALAAVRRALVVTHGALNDAQQALAEHDPLHAAQWFADAAARALAERPPDVPKAHRHQRTAADALGHAWRASLRLLADERLALARRYRSIVRSRDVGYRPSGPWDRLATDFRSGDGDAHVTEPIPPADAVPAGYQDQLRLYFDALRRVQQDQPKVERK